MDPNAKNNDGDTPLHTACSNERSEQVKLLVRAERCNPHEKNSRGDTALHFACHHRQAGEMVIHCLTHCCHVPVVCVNTNCNKNLISILENVVRGTLNMYM